MLLVIAGLLAPLSILRATEGSDLANILPGRLFTTPENRQILDRLRRGERVPKPVLLRKKETDGADQPKTAAPGEPIIQGPRFLTVSGLVQKRDGSFVAWLNGKSFDLATGMTGEGFVVSPTRTAVEEIAILLEDHATPFLLKPGQTLDADQKKIDDSFRIPERVRQLAQRGKPLPVIPVPDPSAVGTRNEKHPDSEKTTQKADDSGKSAETNSRNAHSTGTTPSGTKKAGKEMDPDQELEPDKIFDLAKKVKNAGKGGGIKGLLDTATEVSRAVGQ
ncbi:MAG: hypothetical protein HQL65_00050 [Magnetococcales bacterium]|nr:hypothetical protein [Magnetococcales bacterium]